MSANKTMGLVIFFLFAVCLFFAAKAAENELTLDFEFPTGVNASTLDGSFFTFIGFRDGVTAGPGEFAAKKATVLEFPALKGLGISYVKLFFQAGSINAPHIHPRGSEILYIEEGWLTVGLIDSSNNLYVQKLVAGDAFVFPKGLVHFQVNDSPYETKAIAALSSSNAGTVSIATNVFASGIDDNVLSRAFNVNVTIIQAIKSALTS